MKYLLCPADQEARRLCVRDCILPARIEEARVNKTAGKRAKKRNSRVRFLEAPEGLLTARSMEKRSLWSSSQYHLPYLQS